MRLSSGVSSSGISWYAGAGTVAIGQTRGALFCDRSTSAMARSSPSFDGRATTSYRAPDQDSCVLSVFQSGMVAATRFHHSGAVVTSGGRYSESASPSSPVPGTRKEMAGPRATSVSAKLNESNTKLASVRRAAALRSSADWRTESRISSNAFIPI